MLDFDGSPDLRGEVEANVSFLSEPPPLDLLFRNANFDLCEGRKVVGHAQLLPVTESLGPLPTARSTVRKTDNPLFFEVMR